MSDPLIFANRIICPDGTILHSKHRHDFVRHVQEDGREYFVDGGRDYVRCGGSDLDYVCNTITELNTHDEVREAYVWGKKNFAFPDGVEWILLKDMDSDHIDNVIIYLDELKYPIDNSKPEMLSTVNHHNNKIERTTQMLHNELRYREKNH